jgi:mRNA interferase HigB
VRVISRKVLREFWAAGHADAEMALRAWFDEAESANWQGPGDIKKLYPSASILGKDRVVFNIRGNRYRLVVAIKYELRIVYIRFVGTHAQYDKINCLEV